VIWIRTNDLSRKPEHWTELIRPGQYAVFLFDAPSHVARDCEGRPFEAVEGASIALCDSLSEASTFAKELTRCRPELCCEIYDHEGKSKEPVQVVYNPAVRPRYEGLEYSKRQAFRGSLILACGIAFVVHDFMRDLTWIWGYVIGAKFMVIGGFQMGQGLIGWYEHRGESPEMT
jgi:hypothetical protein